VSAVLFDATNTLFELTPLRERFGSEAVEAWFQRLQHSASTLTVTGAFRPFDEIAKSAFATTAAELGLDAEPDEVGELLSQLPPAEDAADALAAAEAGGLTVAILTNGGRDNVQKLLDRAGLTVVRIFTAADVEAYKPAPEPYLHAVEELELDPQQATLIAAHGWDVLGALGAGLQAVWVDRGELEWPFPVGEPRRAPDLLRAVELALGG
jgi:2-haloacid dehalogenase